MATLLSEIEVLVRRHLVEPKPRFWSSDELVGIMNAGFKDLWRPVVDLKQEHFLTWDTQHVTLGTNTDRLSGVPDNIHKVYLIEATNSASGQTNQGLVFTPKDLNHKDFQGARARSAIDPSNDSIYYCVTGQGGPVGAPVIYTAPQVTSVVAINFGYIPTLEPATKDDINPIPGESDNAIVAWTVAYARAKEREDRTPDPGWLAIYGTEKQSLLQSLGLRQLQEPSYAEAVFREYWG